jgi:hypothetical protein
MLAATSVTRTLALPSESPVPKRRCARRDLIPAAPPHTIPASPPAAPPVPPSAPRSSRPPTLPPPKKDDGPSIVHHQPPARPDRPVPGRPPINGGRRLSFPACATPLTPSPHPESRPTWFSLFCRRRPVPTCAQNSLRRRRRISLWAACRFLRAAPTGHESRAQVGRRDPAQVPGNPHPAGSSVGIPGCAGRPTPAARRHCCPGARA